MLVAFAFNPKDQALALKNAEWIATLKNNKPHDFLVVHDSRCDPKKICALLGTNHTLSIKDHWNKCPGSPEAMFAQTARHLEYTMPVKYWLWMEVDAFPTQDYWLDKIQEEHLRGGKRFTGALVNRWEDCPEHLSGIAVYPNPLVLYAGLMLLAEGENIQFDVVDADNVRNQSHFTDLIQNRTSRRVKENEVWRELDQFPPFKDKADFYSVATKECVLFHSDKFGRIPEIFGAVGHGKESPTAETPSKASPDLRGSDGSEPKPAAANLILTPSKTTSIKAAQKPKFENGVYWHPEKMGD